MNLNDQLEISNIGIQSGWSVGFNNFFPLAILTPEIQNNANVKKKIKKSNASTSFSELVVESRYQTLKTLH